MVLKLVAKEREFPSKSFKDKIEIITNAVDRMNLNRCVSNLITHQVAVSKQQKRGFFLAQPGLKMSETGQNGGA